MVNTGYAALGKSGFPSGSAAACPHYSFLNNTLGTVQEWMAIFSQEGCWLKLPAVDLWLFTMVFPIPDKQSPRMLEGLIHKWEE